MTSYYPKPSDRNSLEGRLVRVLIALVRLGRPPKPQAPDSPDELFRIWVRHRKGRRVIR